jgi:hypothetical protein
MKINLYDHRKEQGLGFYQDMGKIPRFSFTLAGCLRIPKTDLLFSLDIKFTKSEMETLRLRLNEIHAGRMAKNKPLVLSQVDEILDNKKSDKGGPQK